MSVPDKSIDPRLLESAKAEFLKQGFIKAELKRICENANITTGAVYKRYKGKTLLVIAHRLNTIVSADNIMVIKDGQITESGDHERLMQKDGIYHSMVTKRAVSTGWKN